MRTFQAVVLTALATATAQAAPGDQLTLTTGYASNVTTYDRVHWSGAGPYATGLTEDPATGRMMPVITLFKPDGTINTSFGTNGHSVITSLSANATSTSLTTRSGVCNLQGTQCWDELYLYVTTATSVEVYTHLFDKLNPTWNNVTNHSSTVSFPNGVVGPIDSYVVSETTCERLCITTTKRWFVTTARQTAGGALYGVIVRPGVTGFGSNGVLWVSGGDETRLRATNSCEVGYICAIGRARDTTGSADVFAVKVSMTTGAYNTSFDGDGKKRFNFSVTGKPHSIGVDFMTGLIGGASTLKWYILANVCATTGQCVQAVVRLNTNGSVDTSWSGNGTEVFNAGGYSSTAAGGIALYQSRMYFGGQMFTDSTFSNANSFLVALNPSTGVLDSSFGTGGVRTYNNYGGVGLEGYVYTGTYNDGTAVRVISVGDRDTSSGTVQGIFAKHVL